MSNPGEVKKRIFVILTKARMEGQITKREWDLFKQVVEAGVKTLYYLKGSIYSNKTVIRECHFEEKECYEPGHLRMACEMGKEGKVTPGHQCYKETINSDTKWIRECHFEPKECYDPAHFRMVCEMFKEGKNITPKHHCFLETTQDKHKKR